MVVSSESSFPIDKIAAAAKTPLWYQVYAEGDPGPSRARIQEAVKAGCKALCITVGAAYRNATGIPNPTQLAGMATPALNWSVIDPLRQDVGVPVILKGIMSPAEADAAVKKGIQGIVVSNYGGLPTRGTTSSMEILASIVDAAGGRVPVLVDGGFRRGSDILKALALGATAVMVGRPAIWGLAAYGAEGVQSVLEMLQTETGRSMCQCGKPNLKSIDRAVVKIHEV
jgi:isopentenyl diphosphate isomerase/L-lactate dehydrogenase-like FMN-dependent dehydrogenase